MIMITKEQIKEITEKCKLKGVDIKVGDIAYALLCGHFAEHDVAYRALFGKDSTTKEFERYEQSKETGVVRQVLKEYVDSGTSIQDLIASKDITFEQNKEALIAMLDRISKAVSNEELDMKDALKMEKDIRVALNDKFGTAEESAQQFVIVEAKFNHICEWTRKECFLQTEEYAKKQWGLVNKEEFMKEIRNDYDLIPKKK